MSNLSKILLPSLVGVFVYTLVDKFFPEKNPTEFKTVKLELIKALTKKLLKDRALKAAIMSIFATAAIQHFYAEIQALLTSELINKLVEHNSTIVTSENGDLKIFLGIAEDLDLPAHTKAMRELIVAGNLSEKQKIKLLKIKLDAIINGDCIGRKRFVLMMAVGLLFAVTLSGVGGLTLMLEALYELFREGKISEALYHQLRKLLLKKAGVTDVPAEHLVN